tara:strand:- start:4852 stop:5655 length:804 start_codon:yes stop_codon:yes gene_type:complete
MENLPKQDLVKEKFNWEIPVEAIPLPSEGKVYPKSSPLHGREMLEIKAMTAQEEDILSSPGLIKQGTVLNHLIASCLIDKSIDVGEMLAGDRNAIMVAIRITGYGSDYRVKATCPSCTRTSDQQFNLGQLEIKRLTLKSVSPDGNVFEFVLPVTGKTVNFKFMTGNDEARRSTHMDRMEKATGPLGIVRGVTSRLEYQIISIDGVEDTNAIKQFISKMPAKDSKTLRKFIKDNEPGVDLSGNIFCPHCSYEGRVALPIGASFFWPDW